MAPEQARSAQDVSFSSDQYALGVVLYHCLTGELPFSGRSLYQVLQAVMTAPVKPPSQCVPDVPQALDAIVSRVMGRKPEERFGSARDLGPALKSLRS